MDENPKRRISKNNPYRIKKYGEKNLISFKDTFGIYQEIEIEEKLYIAFNEFELEDIKEMNEFDRHIEHSELYENNLEKRIKNKSESLEDKFIRNLTIEELKKAIDKLENPYKKRIKMYYFYNLNETQIADIEGITQQGVSKSLNVAIENLRNFLKKFQN